MMGLGDELEEAEGVLIEEDLEVDNGVGRTGVDDKDKGGREHDEAEVTVLEDRKRSE